MIGNYLLNAIANILLHIEINTLRSGISLPKPYDSNKLSTGFRALFERRWVTTLVGVNIATAMAMVPLVGTDQLGYEPPINFISSELTSAADTEALLTTKNREFINPVQRLRFIGQGFKPGHYGYDLNAYMDDPVVAFTSGVVSHLEFGKSGYGTYIVLDHGHNLFSLYAHLGKVEVSLGQVVDTGQKIGEIGMTGYTTGPHLHFEIHDNGSAVDPKNFITF